MSNETQLRNVVMIAFKRVEKNDKPALQLCFLILCNES